MPPFRVGLTGGLASGKSTVARLLAEAGFQVVDADAIVAELYAPGEPGARAVAEKFGAKYLDKGGAVDKPRLARLVFSDDAARATLEAAIHPLVRAFFSRLATAAATPIVLRSDPARRGRLCPGLRSHRDRRSRARSAAREGRRPRPAARGGSPPARRPGRWQRAASGSAPGDRERRRRPRSSEPQVAALVAEIRELSE